MTGRPKHQRSTILSWGKDSLKKIPEVKKLPLSVAPRPTAEVWRPVIRPNELPKGGHIFSTLAYVLGGPPGFKWQQGGYAGMPKSAPGPLIDALPYLLGGTMVRLPATAPIGARAVKRLAGWVGQREAGMLEQLPIQQTPKALIGGAGLLKPRPEKRRRESRKDQGNKE
ncbi:hypothetical protein ACFL2Q_08120 [Thermodesulfobacteriota bacterium]